MALATLTLTTFLKVNIVLSKLGLWLSNLFYQSVDVDRLLCILAMFTMSHKDVKYVNWPNLGVLSLHV